MTNVLLIMFTISLLYLGIAHRCLPTLKILAFQGVLLFGIAFIELIQINAVNLTFVLLETIVVKRLLSLCFVNYVMKSNRITRDAEPFLPNFISLIIITLIIITTFILSNAISDTRISKIYFVVALSTFLQDYTLS